MKRNLALLLAIGCLTLSITPAAAAVTFYACVNNSTGALTIVTATTNCKTGFHKIQWNQTGPTGPQGARGLTGATGPQGRPGPVNAYIKLGNTSGAGDNWTTSTLSLSVPQGSYAVWTHSNLQGTGPGSMDVQCFLTTGGTNVIDQGYLAFQGGTATYDNITLAGIGTVGSSGDLTLTCNNAPNGFTSSVMYDQIVAIPLSGTPIVQ